MKKTGIKKPNRASPYNPASALAKLPALLLALSMAAALALTPSTAKPDPLQLTGITVTDASGYALPFAAADAASPLAENQAAYVVVSFALAGSRDGGHAGDPHAPFALTITSSTLDLRYADTTGKWLREAGGTITMSSIAASAAEDKVLIEADRGALFSQADQVSRYAYAFLAVTKPAAAGEVTARLSGAPAAFAGTPASLTCFSDGVAKYTVVRHGEDGGSYAVYGGDAVTPGDYLFTYVQEGGRFIGIGNPGLLAWTYDGRLIDPVTQRDYTHAVAQENQFFGFSFGYGGAATDESFRAKAEGKAAVVSDTYSCATAAVTLPDEDVPIAPTGDATTVPVVVLAAAALLCAGALALATKGRR